MLPSEDSYLTAQLETLERLILTRPDHPEAHRARRLVRRVRYYQTRALPPRTLRYILGDLRVAARTLETNEPRGRDPPP